MYFSETDQYRGVISCVDLQVCSTCAWNPLCELCCL